MLLVEWALLRATDAFTEGPLASLLERAVIVVLADPTQAADAAIQMRGKAFSVLERADAPPPGLALLVDGAVQATAASAGAPHPIVAEPEVVVASRAMRTLVAHVTDLADASASFLLLGEDGTGKRTLSRLCHARGRRARLPYVVLGLRELGREDDLEGVVDDALRATGAGTLVLDRIDALEADAQTTLIRLVREPGMARIVATALPTLRDRERSGAFSTELYYRVARHVLDVPPLSVRADDLPVLAYSFLRATCERLGLAPKRISSEALRALRAAEWKGNLPELEACVSNAAAAAGRDVLALGDFGFDRPTARRAVAAPESYVEARRAELHAFERAYVESVLAHTGGNVTRAAEIAGMDRANFRRLLRRTRREQAEESAAALQKLEP